MRKWLYRLTHEDHPGYTATEWRNVQGHLVPVRTFTIPPSS